MLAARGERRGSCRRFFAARNAPRKARAAVAKPRPGRIERAAPARGLSGKGGSSGAGRTVTWNSFNKVASIAQGTTSVAYAYGPDHQRVKETTSVGASTTITHYFGISPAGVNFEFVDGPTQDTWNDYLYAGGEMVGVQKRIDGGGVQSTRYFVKDHLGSIAVLTTETGVVAERLAFDAWGKRRNANGSDDVPGTLTAQTTRGFTGHEMLRSRSGEARKIDPADRF